MLAPSLAIDTLQQFLWHAKKKKGRAKHDRKKGRVGLDDKAGQSRVRQEAVGLGLEQTSLAS